MKSDPTGPTLAELGLDPGLVLLKDTGALLDPRFVAALVGEVEGQLGCEDSAAALLQIGFANGLRDAYRVVDAAFAGVRPDPAAATPALALRFQLRPAPTPRGAIEVHGSWPERVEAAARLSRDGQRSACSCILTAGYTSGWLSGTLDADVLALELECSATGAESCRFVAREAEAWRARGDPRAAALLDVLPFAAFRGMVRSEAGPEDPPAAGPEAGIDREAAVVHIWGPVMVIPYSGSEEALQAVELIGSDPGARDVSVVVVDLGGAVLDEAFGALALERIVETAERWGAETLLADVSPLTERIVADMARPPVLVHKTLDEAIAVAFQIARSQHANL